MKETQHDFGLTAGPPVLMEIIMAPRPIDGGLGSLETSEDDALPFVPHTNHLYRPADHVEKKIESAWAVRDGSKDIVFRAPVPNDGRFLFDPKSGTVTPLTNGAAPAPKGLPTVAAERKQVPIYSGFVKYFPRAICAVASLSFKGNQQHHPDKPLHWDKSKSGDHQDALCRHMVDDAMGVPVDTDSVLHKTKVAWRAMADLEMALS